MHLTVFLQNPAPNAISHGKNVIISKIGIRLLHFRTPEILGFHLKMYICCKPKTPLNPTVLILFLFTLIYNIRIQNPPAEYFYRKS